MSPKIPSASPDSDTKTYLLFTLADPLGPSQHFFIRLFVTFAPSIFCAGSINFAAATLVMLCRVMMRHSSTFVLKETPTDIVPRA